MSQGRYLPFPDVPPVLLAEAAVKKEPGLEQMPNETDIAYRAFLQYCIMGPDARAEDVARSVDRSQGMLTRYRVRNHWTARIEEWWRSRKARELQATGLSSAAEDEPWQKRREQFRHEEWELHSELVKAGREALDRWRASDKVPNLGEIAKMFELASRLARLASGLPLNHTEMSGNVEMPIKVQIEAALERAYGAEVVDTGPPLNCQRQKEDIVPNHPQLTWTQE